MMKKRLQVIKIDVFLYLRATMALCLSVRKNRMLKVLLSGLSISLMSAFVSGADISAGQVKSQECVACHGADGISQIPLYPSLAGKEAHYLAESLYIYRDKGKKGAMSSLMWGIAGPLSDQEIEDLSAYFASLPPAP